MRRITLALLALAICLATFGDIQTRAQLGSFRQLSNGNAARISEVPRAVATVTINGANELRLTNNSSVDQRPDWGRTFAEPTPNRAPVAVDDTYIPTGRFTPISVAAPGVLANDTDADGDQLTAELVAGPSHGTATLQPDGSFTYTWSPGWADADTFTYRVSDGKEWSSTAIVHIQMFPNVPPVAVDDSYTVAQGQTLTVTPPGVLVNDADADGDHLLAHAYKQPDHGSLNFDIQGGFAYTPAAGFTGTDTFTYRADDGTAMRSNEATVTINVTPAATPTPTPTPTPAEVFVQFSSATFEIAEGCVPATLTVTLTNGAKANRFANNQTVTVDYAITGGTASQKSDYTYVAGTLIESVNQPTKNILGRLVFEPGGTSQTIQILVNEDAYVEPSETVEVTLSNPQGAVLGSPITTTLTILDNDRETFAPSNPIDEPQNFVCQQYHDFLHRQPDDAGLAFWTNQITQCGTDGNCIDGMRHNVAMAFFLSSEYQQTGYFIDRLYEACLNRRPVYEEYMRDLHVVGMGVEVGVGDWQTRLEDNKRKFAEEFVGRGEFLARYPLGMTAANFVDEMFEYAGVDPAPDERQAAIDAFGAGDVVGRAAAMRKAMESASVFRAYYNRAFVLAEYFGYLRRDPNDPPDTNWTGYDFWLGKMNQFSLPAEDVAQPADAYERVKRSEMVKAFIRSAEYRQRFGGN